MSPGSLETAYQVGDGKDGPGRRAGALLRLRSISRDVAEHYNVEAAHIILNDTDGTTRLEAVWGELGVSAPATLNTREPDLRFVRHSIGWNLPIIILDAAKDDRFNDTTRHGFRFTAVMPLALGPNTRCGTLAIVGVNPRERFGLQDCAFLELKAREIVRLLRRRGFIDGVEDHRLSERLYWSATSTSTSTSFRAGGAGLVSDDVGAGDQADSEATTDNGSTSDGPRPELEAALKQMTAQLPGLLGRAPRTSRRLGAWPAPAPAGRPSASA